MTKLLALPKYLLQRPPSEHSIAVNAMLSDIATACKKISVAIDVGALKGNMGVLESENVQGEVQKALDMIANDIFIETVKKSGYVAGLVSEELDSAIEVQESQHPLGQYLVLFDPLDGSSNVNVNISVGTIFSILHSQNQAPLMTDYCQSGSKQICAGYALYGTSTMLVLTTGQGVDGFTLDHEANEFYLTHPQMRIQEDTAEFAINMSNYRFWEAPVTAYIDECLQGKDGERGKDFNMRWVASMVAEIHRILVRGGVFMYPLDSKIKKNGGKLRLMYEANPMAMIVEAAGGLATNGATRMLDMSPSHIHERVPVVMGSRHEVERISAFYAKAKNENAKD
jgi:fructose-1,6-bisphosphatase I